MRWYRGGAVNRVHFGKTGGIPQLGAKVPIALDTVHRQFKNAAYCGHLREAKAQRIGPKRIDNFQRVNHIAAGLRHFLTFFIPHQLMQINRVKRNFIHHGQLHHHHPGHPEKQNILTGDKHIGGVVFFQRFGLLGPAQGADWPKPR